MEKLLHYTWKHRLYPLGTLTTTDDRTVEVIDPGLHNRGDAGPDFFNAKIRVNGIEWVGNVELHLKASDWFRHGHDKDAAYDNVILHVVEDADMDVMTSSGRMPAQMVLAVPERLKVDYEHLLHQDKYPPCHEKIPDIPKVKTHMFMSALQTERLERKTREIVKRMEVSRGSWEDAYFQTLARNFGFGVNSEAFEVWATKIDLSKAAHHRDDLFQIEALFLGQAGLLEAETSQKRGGIDSLANIEAYRREYNYLQKKFGLEPMDAVMWKYLRTRPQNFPHVRIMELAKMYHEQRTGLSQMLDCKDVKAVGKLLGVKGSKLDLIVINTVIPIMFAYGRQNGKETLCERAFDLFDEIKPEDNNIVRMWQECGLHVRSAGDSQALIQLKKEYCDKKECLRCRIGREVLAKQPLPPTPPPLGGKGVDRNKQIRRNMSENNIEKNVTTSNPLEGQVKGKYMFQTRMEVRDYECDIQGIVNNANYLHYLEHTRHCFLRSKDMSFAALHEQGVDVVVARMELQYKVPLKCDDEFISCLNVTKEGIRYIFHQDIFRATDNKLCIRAKVELVGLRDGKLAMTPEYDVILD